jgi:hypothetical protein
VVVLAVQLLQPPPEVLGAHDGILRASVTRHTLCGAGVVRTALPPVDSTTTIRP